VSGLAFAEIGFSYPSALPFGSAAPLVFDAFSWQTPVGRTVILGPNGAGKTTLLSLGASALRPRRGAVSFGHLDPRLRRDRAGFRKAVGWMPQQVRAVPGLTAREQVAYAGWLKGMGRGDAWAEALTALNRVGLVEEANRRTSQLSGGQQRRVGLASLLVHDASIFLLDEPTVGLDPRQRSRFRETLRELAVARPVVVSTHQVDDLSDLFETVVVLDRGRIRFQGSVSDFMALAPAGPHQAEAAYATLVSGD